MPRSTVADSGGGSPRKPAGPGPTGSGRATVSAVASLESIELFELRLLQAVSETGSLGRVALRYNVTQPAVSMRMSHLERRVGLRLLRRDPSGTRLTPAGEELLAAARPVLSSADALLGVIDRLKAEAAGWLRVAASFTVAEHLAPAWIETVRSEAPEVSLTLEVLNSSQVVRAVGERRVDLGFVEGAERTLPTLSVQTVATDELVIVVAPSVRLARRRRPLDPAQLAELDLIVRERGSGTREIVDRALAPWGGPSSRLELGSSEALLAAARRGEGPAVLSRLAVADDLAAGRLVEVPVSGVDLTRTIRAVWMSDIALGPLARRLLRAASSTAGPQNVDT